MTEPTTGSAADLTRFLTWAGDKGEMNPSTARALKSSVGKVLEVVDGGEDVDVTSLDVDDVLRRWENLNRTNYSASSLQTYKGRFRQALAMYSAWLVNDPNWKNAGKGSPAAGTKPTVKRGRPRKAAEPSEPDPSEAADRPTTTGGVRMVAYELPLRPDLLVRMTLPVDLSKADASRISAFVSSLAFASGEGALSLEET